MTLARTDRRAGPPTLDTHECHVVDMLADFCLAKAEAPSTWVNEAEDHGFTEEDLKSVRYLQMRIQRYLKHPNAMKTDD
jgi:hypothetical protein